MTRPPHVSLPVSDPLALIDATLLFLVQVLLAKHPDLAEPPDDDEPRPPPALRAARHILGAIREVHYAIETYNAFLPTPPTPRAGAGDDIPF
jgi:hypothetical protein